MIHALAEKPNTAMKAAATVGAFRGSGGASYFGFEIGPAAVQYSNPVAIFILY